LAEACPAPAYSGHGRLQEPADFLFSAFVFIDFAVYFLYGNEQQL
jgi:hypothetical protein